MSSSNPAARADFFAVDGVAPLMCPVGLEPPRGWLEATGAALQAGDDTPIRDNNNNDDDDDNNNNNNNNNVITRAASSAGPRRSRPYAATTVASCEKNCCVLPS